MTSVKPPGTQLELLKDRNDKLFAQAAVQRQENDRLQRRIDELEAKEQGRQESLLLVNRLWEELNSSIAFLQFK